MEQLAAKMSAKKLQRLQKVCDPRRLEEQGKVLMRYSDRDDRRRSMDSRLLALWTVSSYKICTNTMYCPISLTVNLEDLGISLGGIPTTRRETFRLKPEVFTSPNRR